MTTRVTITPVRPPKPGIIFELDGDETLSGGVGGWESLDRPRNTPATAWVGTPAKTLELPLLLDGREAFPGFDLPVEGDCRRLERWGLPTGKTGEPDVLQVDGLVRVATADRWVIQDITWGEYEVNEAAQRVMQVVTLSLLQYARAELVASRAKRARKRRRADQVFSDAADSTSSGAGS